MPTTLADLINQRRTISVNVLGHELQVSYRPGYLTPTASAKIRQLSDEDGGDESSIHTFLGLIESWDLLGDDGKPVPLKHDELQKVPFVVLNLISQRCYEDMQPGKRK